MNPFGCGSLARLRQDEPARQCRLLQGHQGDHEHEDAFGGLWTWRHVNGKWIISLPREDADDA